jgi:glyoxylase-like metal-dependent hydrolase (beta-lactamase superfamily II)
VRELQTGLWHWRQRTRSGDRDSSLEWERQEVSSYAIDDGDGLLLFDPLALPSQIEELAAGRDTTIVLTCPWHERDTRSLVDRLDAAVFVPQPEEGDPIEGRQLFSAGDRLPVGVEAFPGRESNDLVLWVESRRVLVAGDTLIDRGPGLEFSAWPRVLGDLDTRGRPARADPRRAPFAARAAGRARARDARRADRPSRPRARALLTRRAGARRLDEPLVTFS